MGSAASTTNSLPVETKVIEEPISEDTPITGIIGISNDVVGRMMAPSPQPTSRFNVFLDNYIVRKIKSLRKEREEAQRELEAEYERQERVKELNRAFVEGIMWVNNKRRVMECYQKYPNHPMMCAEEVRAFTEAVPWNRDGNFTSEHTMEV